MSAAPVRFAAIADAAARAERWQQKLVDANIQFEEAIVTDLCGYPPTSPAQLADEVETDELETLRAAAHRGLDSLIDRLNAEYFKHKAAVELAGALGDPPDPAITDGEATA